MNIDIKCMMSFDDYCGSDDNGVILVFDHKPSDAFLLTEYRVFMNYTDKTVCIQQIDDCDIIDLYYLTDITPEYQYDMMCKYIEMFESECRLS